MDIGNVANSYDKPTRKREYEPVAEGEVVIPKNCGCLPCLNLMCSNCQKALLAKMEQRDTEVGEPFVDSEMKEYDHLMRKMEALRKRMGKSASKHAESATRADEWYDASAMVMEMDSIPKPDPSPFGSFGGHDNNVKYPGGEELNMKTDLLACVQADCDVVMQHPTVGTYARGTYELGSQEQTGNKYNPIHVSQVYAIEKTNKANHKEATTTVIDKDGNFLSLTKKRKRAAKEPEDGAFKRIKSNI
ncbi:hypothetical protein EJ04DRAFT_558779 [Polyplosphaeria fusca]|uniref:Uncharacterized protein n=1 Tax=Polyplosphaeria fusca TaxID=682080 RepID=A0A9P4R7S1_9PLEO|nr:hypothetical protein EJ04DRAFT_558779 [Polyplosphaeria fusca]